MTSNAGTPKNAPSPLMRSGRRAVAGPRAGVSDGALRDLSEAIDRYVPTADTGRPAKRRVRLTLPLAAALTLGVVLVLLEPFEYVCGASLRVATATTPEQVASLRAELMYYAWEHLTEHGDAGVAPARWYADAPTDGSIRLCLQTTDIASGTRRLRALVRGYLAEFERRMATARSTPTEAESVLSDYAAELQQRFNVAQLKVKRSLNSLPATDPREKRTMLLERWEALRAQFATTRERLDGASVELARLKAQPEPTHGIVSHEDRTEALLADGALQQDLRELTVSLTELKLHLLNVWQDSAGDLERLDCATDDLIAAVAQPPVVAATNPRDDRGRSPLAGSPARRDGGTSRQESPGESAVEVARRYRDVLQAFSTAWNKDFSLLRQLDVDPQSGEILSIYQRVRSALGDYLYTASKHLAALRANVLTLGDDLQDRARLHVFESRVARNFNLVQNAHRRFEFKAGALDARGNFRLDTALRSARGLGRRSRKRIEQIDELLQEKAREQARKQQAEALANAQQEIEHLRAEAIEAVEQMVSLQGELNASAELSEEFLRSTLQAEFAGRLVQSTRADLGATEERLRGFAAKRSSTPAPALELVGCGVIAGPLDLRRRVTIAGTAAIIAFVILTTGQWLLHRR